MHTQKSMSGSGTVKAFAGTVKAKYFKPTIGVDLPGASLIQTGENVILDNTSATGSTIVRLGTDTSATSFQLQDNSETALWSFDGTGNVTLEDLSSFKFTVATSGSLSLEKLGFNINDTSNTYLAFSKAAETAKCGLLPPWNSAPSNMNSSRMGLSHEFFDDFIGPLSSAWNETADSTGAATSASQVGGVVSISCAAAADNDACQIQLTPASFLLADSKDVWFEARVRFPKTDVINLDWYIGVAEIQDITGAAGNRPNDGIGFYKNDGDTHINCASSDGVTHSVATELGTLLTNTWLTLSLHMTCATSGTSTLVAYIDNIAVATITDVEYGSPAVMSPLFMVRNGDATTTQVLEVDYVKVAQLR